MTSRDDIGSAGTRISLSVVPRGRMFLKQRQHLYLASTPSEARKKSRHLKNLFARLCVARCREGLNQVDDFTCTWLSVIGRAYRGQIW